MTIKWTAATRKIAELTEYPNNPRAVNKKAFKKLIENIRENGYTNRLIINSNDVVLGGNQRLKALKELGYTEIDVLVPNVSLTKEQEERINVTDNIATGAWDFDRLSGCFDAEQLIDWGMQPEMLGKSHFDFNEEPEKIKEKKTKTCPSCGEIL